MQAFGDAQSERAVGTVGAAGAAAAITTAHFGRGSFARGVADRAAPHRERTSSKVRERLSCTRRLLCRLRRRELDVLHRGVRRGGQSHRALSGLVGSQRRQRVLDVRLGLCGERGGVHHVYLRELGANHAQRSHVVIKGPLLNHARELRRTAAGFATNRHLKCRAGGDGCAHKGVGKSRSLLLVCQRFGRGLRRNHFDLKLHGFSPRFLLRGEHNLIARRRVPRNRPAGMNARSAASVRERSQWSFRIHLRLLEKDR
mmetsp:Transcript_18753/g.61231  ORF Transcript_18753/g.61231 Transcript_18753/m.61231 type:complete len:257 (-) Transcript_18753:644-1414(-)